MPRGLPRGCLLEGTRRVLDVITFSQRDELPQLPAEAKKTFVGFNVVAARLDALMPAAHETYIPLPKKGLIAAYAIAADAPHPNARSYVYLDAAANVVRSAPFATASASFRLYYWMLSLHTATTGGWVVQLLLLCATLSVPVLAWTGVASYLKRRAAKSASRQTATARAPAIPAAVSTN